MWNMYFGSSQIAKSGIQVFDLCLVILSISFATTCENPNFRTKIHIQLEIEL